MKITLIGVNYAPEDTAIGLYSTQMVEFLSQNHQVEVITGFPYYPQWEIREEYKKKSLFFTEEINGIEVKRFKQYVPKSPSFLKRIIHLSSFTIGSIIHLFKAQKSDLAIVIVPFTSTVLVGLMMKLFFGTKVWVHIQDFEFDAAIETGMLKNKTLSNFLLKIESFLFNKADFSSTISNSMIKKMENKSKHKSYFLPNWIDEDKINPAKSTKMLFDKAKFNVLYSGNIGEKQDWKVFYEVVEQLKDQEDIQFYVFGAGAKRDEVKGRCKFFQNVTFRDPVPFEDLNDLLCSADLHILFQKLDVVDTVMPSKILGMLASEKPSIVTGNKDSEVRKVMKESRGGSYFSHKNPSKIAEEVLHYKEIVTSCRQAREYVVKYFSKENVLGNLDREIERMF